MILSFFLLFGCSGGKKEASAEVSDSQSETQSQGMAMIEDDVSDKNILQIAMGSPDHTTLVAAVLAAGLEHVLANPGPLTVFAPTNAAFDALPEGTVDNLLKPENKGTLANIITHHAAAGTFEIDDFEDGVDLDMAVGGYVQIGVAGDKVTVNGGNILGSVDASNGVVHVIDVVLLPAEN